MLLSLSVKPRVGGGVGWGGTVGVEMIVSCSRLLGLVNAFWIGVTSI